MSTILITVMIAFFVILGALAALGVGWLLTGKPKIQPGTCGRDPTKKKKEECGTEVSCSLCEKNTSEKNTPEKNTSEKK